MILGVIIMTITGFVSHMLGFGEPGIIIVTGGACFCAVGLFLLCFGKICSWTEFDVKLSVEKRMDVF
jgi:hypothetical protein